MQFIDPRMVTPLMLPKPVLYEGITLIRPATMPMLLKVMTFLIKELILQHGVANPQSMELLEIQCKQPRLEKLASLEV